MSVRVSALYCQCRFQIALRFGVAWLETQNFAKLSDGRIELARVAERLAEAEMRLDQAGLNRQCSPVFRDGGVACSGFLQQPPQIVARLHALGIHPASTAPAL